MAIDFERLKSQNDIVDVIGRYVSLKKQGTEYYGQCPFHDDAHASLQVNPRKQIFKCFPCGAGGDIIDFLTKYGKTIPEAVAILEGDRSIYPGEAEKRTAKKSACIQWKPIKPLIPPASIEHYRHGVPSRIWPYHSADGSLLGFVCRFDTPSGKECLPYSYCTDGERYEWRWQGLERPRPLYNLHKLAAHPDRSIIVVEGEKTADALASLVEGFGKAIVTTWIGGANGINNADWSPLKGRRVLLWPDNDWSHRYGEKHATPNALMPFDEQPGNKAMLAIASMIEPKVLKIIKNPDGKPCGWDVADEPEWTPEQAREYIRANAFDGLQVVADWQQLHAADQAPPPQQQPLEPPPYDGSDEPPYEPEPLSPLTDNPYFKFLGYVNEGGRASHCFFPHGSKIIVNFNNSQLSKAALIDLAPLSFWEHNFPSKRGGVNVEAAINWIANTSQAVGVFSPKMIRGRGAWHDEGRTVVHAGSHLIVDSKATPLGGIKTRYTYEIGEPLGFAMAEPLAAKEASRLVELLKLINWEREINAYLLAGWCVVAPICGALVWRPHIWVTGAAGTGKSWLFQMIVRKMLGETVLAVQGETSEAGLRQMLNHDALPVVFDEAEGEDKKAQERIQSVLNLMRSASADDGGIMAKGSAGGSAVTYRIRSCFAFASIGVTLSQQSDRSRVSILGIRNYHESETTIRKQRWEQITKLYNELLTSEFVAKLQSRTVQLMPIILQNARTFANAAAFVLGAQRTGDQLGALLAGAYSLHSGKAISYDEAVAWVKDKDWSEERAMDVSRDEHKLFTYLMEQMTRVEAGGVVERQIGELVLIAANRQVDQLITSDIADMRLRRLGVKVDRDGSNEYIVIGNSATPILKMLEHQPWAKEHYRVLRRIEGAREYQATKFASGIKCRAVGVPLALLLS